jgi:dienelactone hydrolase
VAHLKVLRLISGSASILLVFTGFILIGETRAAKTPGPKTHFPLHSYPSRSTWTSRAAELRLQIRSAAGMLPAQIESPLRVQIIRTRENEGYATEAILFETLPGYFVGGTIYRPAVTGPRHPGVLIAHGHWKGGRIEHQPEYSVPALGINLALQGYVAFAWDMAGYNDTTQTPHDFGGDWREQLWSFNPLGLQLHNSIRALDYLVSRPDVDSSRIAMTGASGGATQTILLTAVDDRIHVSAPVNMISAHYQGADPCEEAPNLRLETNNVEIAALMAPRPMLVISCTGDWTRNTPVEEFPALQRAYQLFGCLPEVSNAHFEADHNYNAATREAVYRFLSRELLNRDVEIKDQPVRIDAESLLIFNGRQRPQSALGYKELFQEWMAASRAQTDSLADIEALRQALRSALAVRLPEKVAVRRHGSYVFLNGNGLTEDVRGIWMPGQGVPAIVVHPEGYEAARDTPEVRKLRAEGRPVLLIDAFQTGISRVERDRGGRWFLSYNRTDDALRVQDILTAIKFVHSETGQRPWLAGLGNAGVWCLFAAAVSDVPVAGVVDLNGFRGSDEDFHERFFVPGIQRVGGLKTAMRLTKLQIRRDEAPVSGWHTGAR